MIAPETVFLAMDTKIGRDVLIEPHVVIGPGVAIEDGAIDPRLLASRGRACRRRRVDRSLRAAAAGRRYRREGEGRQFRRDQGGDRSRPAPRSIISAISATRGSARAPTSAPGRSPAITTASTSTRPTSAPAPSSAPTRRWSRRSRSATAPMSARARSSPRMSSRRPRGRARPAGDEAGLGEGVPGAEEERLARTGGAPDTSCGQALRKIGLRPPIIRNGCDGPNAP